MINVVNKPGHSFRGLGAYLLGLGSEKDAERVAYTHCHNLATDDPQKAIRLMIATSKSQDQLKKHAGVRAGGRTSRAHVYHYVLSWEASERAEISREEMIDAALASMSYLGARKGEKIGKKVKAKRTQFADEHQALIVVHDGGPGSNPHVHVMLSRVHPETGIAFSRSMDFERLSSWALQYRRAQGKEDLCPERVKNHAKKARGIKTSHRRKPRGEYEQEQAIAASGSGSRKRAQLEQQDRRARQLRVRSGSMKEAQAKQLVKLDMKHIAAERGVRAKAAEKLRSERSAIRARFSPKIETLLERQESERAAFFAAHETAAGRVRNTWEAFKTKEWMRGIRSRPVHTLKHMFALAYDAGLQLRDIERVHKREEGKMNGQQKREERSAWRGVTAQRNANLSGLRGRYTRDRLDLTLLHDIERAKLKAEWHQLAMDRVAVLAEDGRSPERSAGHSPAGLSGSGGREPTPDVHDQHAEHSQQITGSDPREDGIEEIRRDREKQRQLAKTEAMRERLRKAREERRGRGKDRGL